MNWYSIADAPVFGSSTLGRPGTPRLYVGRWPTESGGRCKTPSASPGSVVRSWTRRAAVEVTDVGSLVRLTEDIVHRGGRRCGSAPPTG